MSEVNDGGFKGLKDTISDLLLNVHKSLMTFVFQDALITHYLLYRHPDHYRLFATIPSTGRVRIHSGHKHYCCDEPAH